MYPPPYHQEVNFDNIIRTIKTFPLATLISVHQDNACITHLPLIYESDGAGYGRLIGHMDQNNPHSNFLDHQKIQIIFHGPDAYISPSRYSTAQLPTWNYIKVHIDGFCKLIKSADAVKWSLIKMTEHLEAPEHHYVLKDNDPKMDQFIKYLVGFEITIRSWEGKFKLSQDKIQADKMGAKNVLQENTQAKVGDFLEEVYNNHQQKRDS